MPSGSEGDPPGARGSSSSEEIGLSVLKTNVDNQGHVLPPPVIQSNSHFDNQNRTRFSPPNTRQSLTVRWARLKRRIAGSAPDESLGDPTATETTSDNGSTFRRKMTRDGSGEKMANGELEEGWVDEVVVDQPLNQYSEWGYKPPTSASEHPNGGTMTSPGTNLPHQSEGSSMRATAFEANGFVGAVGNFCRWRLYPVVKHFFSPAYHDKGLEEAYQKEIWYTQKSTFIFGACFLVLNWVLSVALLPKPWSTWNKITNWAVFPALCVPLVPMAMFDTPRRQPWIWQILLLACTFMYTCTMYFSAALPVVALFALGQKRVVAAFSTTLWVILVGVLILPYRIPYIRNVINIFIFQSFTLYMHYMRDVADRRMYTMRAELKVQFRAKQKAQINERKVMDSNRRFSSYIFHEVRVPLNTALLAVQNLEGAEVFDKNSDTAVEYAALEGSLQMMSQVLNDVLDFTRMEKGGFSSVSRPFSLHNVMRSIFVPLRLDATARGLKLDTSLDLRVDEVAYRAAFPDHLEDQFESVVQVGDGIVMGDEMRLRQIINNLSSNGCKFCPSGGTISIRTTLVFPLDSYEASTTLVGSSGPGTMDGQSDSTTAGGASSHSPRLSQNRLQQHEAKSAGAEGEGEKRKVVVVRIEVQDTGVGIKPKDMMENRLFSAYVQTEIGRHQGGKGTGLGLSLVRQIVLLMGGRLGLKSKVGEGSTFWVEMPFEIGPQTRKADEPHRRVSSAANTNRPDPTFASGTNQYVQSRTQGFPGFSEQGPSGEKGPATPSDLEHIEELPSPPGSPPDNTVPAHFLFSSPPDTPGVSTNDDSAQAAAVGGPTGRMFLSPVDLLKRPEAKTNLSSASAPAEIAPKVKSKALEFEDGPLKVLVVDDDALTRRLMSRMMERLGCTVFTAENGQAALDMLLAVPEDHQIETAPGVDPRSGNSFNNYDITFLDNQMPIMTGPEVVSRLRALARDDLVVAITANAQLSEQENFARNGASAVLTKPVLEDDLRRFLLLANQQRTERKNRPPGTSRFEGSLHPPVGFLSDLQDF
ncbi:hypothetical protein T439DRAFT_352046 [Meredithblackwellia eburnea MCA 4105]